MGRTGPDANHHVRRPSARPARAGSRSALAVVALALLVAACGGSDAATASGPATSGAIYAEVVEHLVKRPPHGDRPLVFVRPHSGHVIDLEVQADVVRRLADVATIRFVDEADEVVLVDEPERPVRDGATVLTVGEIDRRGPRAEVAVERYVDAREVRELCVSLRRTAGDWHVAQESGCANGA